MGKKKRRAVGYCRTSGESQRDNASIPDQKDVIRRACEINGWDLQKFYVDESKSGKSIQGRDQFNQLMRDAANDQFDVVVSLDVKRWGRKGTDILQSTDTLKRQFGVDYVEAKGGFETKAGSSHVVVNYVQAGVAEAERLLIKERTMPARRRVAREKGAPSWGGKRTWPYGREWDVEREVWRVIPDKKEKIQEAARRYLAGERIADLAQEYHMDRTSLHQILRDKCGDTYTVHFGAEPEIGLDAEDVTIKLPRLLPKKTIQRIHKKMETNRTKPRGHKNHNYLLSGMVFCGKCHRSLTPQTSNGFRYYRACGCNCFKGQVNAQQLEDAVVRDLFDLFGNPKKMQEAVDAAIPNKKKQATLEKKQTKLTKEISKVEQQVGRLVDAIQEGVISMSDAKKRREQLREKQTQLESELSQCSEELASVPTAEVLKRVKRLPTKRRMISGPTGLDDITFDEKRALIELSFSGVLPDRRKSGVYVQSVRGKENRRPRPWIYSLLGQLIEEHGRTDIQREDVSPLSSPWVYPRDYIAPFYATGITR